LICIKITFYEQPGSVDIWITHQDSHFFIAKESGKKTGKCKAHYILFCQLINTATDYASEQHGLNRNGDRRSVHG